MKVLLDTNIILDVLLDRQPFAEHAVCLMSKVERGEIAGFLCATTITTIHCLLSKQLAREQAMTSINAIMTMFEVAPVNRLVIEGAFNIKFVDFEDAVLHEAAKHAGVMYIVTRNIKDFKRSTLPVFTPGEFLSMLATLH